MNTIAAITTTEIASSPNSFREHIIRCFKGSIQTNEQLERIIEENPNQPISVIGSVSRVEIPACEVPSKLQEIEQAGLEWVRELWLRSIN